MVWEYKLCTIVMLTRCVEGGKVSALMEAKPKAFKIDQVFHFISQTKCQQYCPNNVKMMTFRDSGIHVTLDNITTFADYEYRRMTIKSVSHEYYREGSLKSVTSQISTFY